MNSCSLNCLVLWQWLAMALCLNMNLTLGTAQDSLGELDNQPLRRYNADFVDCQKISEIVFLGFFPCLRENDSDFEASENMIRECDLLAEAAAYLAVERVNRNPDILPNINLSLYPIYVPSGRESQAVSDNNII